MSSLGSLTSTSDSASTRIELDAAASGDHVVVMAWWLSATQTVSSVTDSQGNTYTSRQVQGFSGSGAWLAAYSSKITTPLSATDYIDITWGSPAYTYRAAEAYALVGCGNYDQSAKGTSEYGQTVSVSASTTASVTSIVGWITTKDSKTYGSSSWTSVGPQLAIGTFHHYRVTFDALSAGAQNPNGSMSANEVWAGIWVAAAAASPPVIQHRRPIYTLLRM